MIYTSTTFSVSWLPGELPVSDRLFDGGKMTASFKLAHSTSLG